MKKSRHLVAVCTCFITFLLCTPNVYSAVGWAHTYTDEQFFTLTNEPPFAATSFDDGGTPGSVTMTFSLASDLDPTTTFLSGLYLNLNVAWDPSVLQFEYDAQNSTAPTASNILTGANSQEAGSAGTFDFLYTWDFGDGSALFTAGETVIYNITAPGLAASDFAFLSEPGASGAFLAAAELGGTGGDGSGTAIIAAPAVPIPAAVWLFGSGLVGLIGIARRKKVA